MTASSIDLYARQVQLIGLPPHTAAAATSAAAAATAVGITNVNVAVQMRPIRPNCASLKRVSRNLFGSPEKGEIKAMLRKENERKLDYLCKRYQFDADVFKNDAANNNAAALPNLIAKELQDYEQRITQEGCNLNRDFVTSSTQAAAGAVAATGELENTSAKVKQITQIKRTATAEDAALCCSERGKPYARQTLLTDCFNKRKATPVTATTTTTQLTAPPPAAATSLTTSSNALKVLELPNPMRATLSLCTSIAVGATATTTTSAPNALPTAALEATCDVPITTATTTNTKTNIEKTPHA